MTGSKVLTMSLSLSETNEFIRTLEWTFDSHVCCGALLHHSVLPCKVHLANYIGDEPNHYEIPPSAG